MRFDFPTIHGRCIAAALIWGAACLLPGPAVAAEPTAKVDFNRSIRPLLSNTCFKCHGPDAAERQAKLRFDERAEALKPAESGKLAIVPGKADESELVRRIFSTDPDIQMPPPDSNKKLSDGERELLKRWIAEGAEYNAHWSFVTPRRPAPPAVRDTAWPRSDIDRFILARIEAAGLRPSAPADKITLIRRLSLDLTGLPPTPAEVDAFVADERSDAYEQLVDRLLASPHYGERMALDWMDAARYADTHGYHIDSGRDMTRWREWVIDAFSRNLPFDQFTVQQLAGDLLPAAATPAATMQQKIASGFHRNHMINYEGGAIPQEYHNAYIVDRVNTTGTVWLGLTIGCTQCHDHKYDPLTQKEFYQLYAFFHNIPEAGLDGQKGNAQPFLRTPTAEQQSQFDGLTAKIQNLQQQIAAPPAAVDAAQAEWEQRAAAAAPQVEWIVLQPSELKSKGGATLTLQADKSILATGSNPATETYVVTASTSASGITAIRLEALPDDSLPAKGPGRSPNGNVVLTDVQLAAGSLIDTAGLKPVKFKAAKADFSQADFPVANAIDEKLTSGWAIYPEVGKPHQVIFEPEKPLVADGETQLRVTLDFLSQYGQHQLGRFRLAVTTAANPHADAVLPGGIAEILKLPADRRSEPQRAELQTYYRTNVSPIVRQLQQDLAAAKTALADAEKRIPTTMVMQEMDQPRETFLLMRGQYDKPGERVAAGVPASLPPLAAGAPQNRLGLAQWLVDPSHPLTARVTVNRFWQTFFGTGIVKTADDFGSQGELPSHPQLLDWLAVEFMTPNALDSPSGGPQAWNVKALVRAIVTSATYRQSSVVKPESLAKDPENRLLARGPRFRLQAEFIRDLALATSGLLNREIGGRSVSPYQPTGIWEELTFRQDNANFTAQIYAQDHGSDLYRRTMYTFWKRTAPPPTLVTFDAPDRETCTVRRSRTNTPLQALVMMNDPTYVEASRKLGERLMAGGATPQERITLGFRLVLGRRPEPREVEVLARIFAEQLAANRANPAAAAKLLAVGESPHDEKLDPAELAAWSMVGSVLLNLDEAITKN